jgi:cytidylate kinase
MKITISGTIGSGKSTVAKMLAKKLNYNYYSTGNYMRALAQKKNITLNEMAKIAEKDKEIDSEIDNYQIELGKKENDFVLEGRLGFHFVPDSLKIFLECDENTAAARILKSLSEGDKSRVNEGLMKDKSKILKDIRKRRASEDQRYAKSYKIDQNSRTNFDYVIDTSKITAEEACNRIMAIVHNKNKSKIKIK